MSRIWYKQDKQEIANWLGCDTYESALITLYESGLSCMEVGEFFDVVGSTILHQLKKNGINIRGRGGPNRARAKDYRKYQIKTAKDLGYETYESALVGLYESGLTCQKIANMFDVTSGHISRMLRDGGCKMRPRGFQSRKKLKKLPPK